MSNSLDSFLTRIGDVTIERVTPRGSPRATDPSGAPSGTLSDGNTNDAEPQTANDESSEDSSGEISEGEQEKKMESSRTDEIEEIHSEGSGDDMDLDETIDTQIGVRMESDRQQSHSLSQDDDVEAVNILDTLPLEGAPIEGQEVSEADLLGKPVSKEIEDAESIDNENEKAESQSGEDEDGEDGSKRHADSDSQDSTKKKQKKEDGNEGSSTECELKAEKKIANMRRNIREVMDETQLDEATLAAQRQEMERLRRVQEQQKIIREVQRQIAINRQNNKTQTRVISLLQGKQNQAGTTISSASSSSSQVRLPSTVLLKVNSGSGSQSSSVVQTNQMQRRSIDAMRWQKGRGAYQGAQTSISRVPNRSTGPNMLQQRIRMMTPSVSISPVIPKKEPIDRSEYYSDSEISDIEADEALREKQLHTMRKMSGTQKAQKLTKGKDVVTISSSSESSDDDCIVLSDPSGGEETDTEDDPSNSGMHTNDRYNVPDEHGRVLINVGHPDTEPDVFLAPQVARIIKPHQIGGIRFLYDNIVESIERFKTSSGFGCILAHSMGLGKTLQVASFCDIFFRCTSAKTVLCIMPINTLQNWLAEFNMWLPYEDASSNKQDSGMNIKLDSVSETKQEIKEECGSQSDISNASRPISTESVHRIGQDNMSQPSNMENPFSHQGYETQSMVPNYMQESMLNKNGAEPNVHISQSYPSDISQSSIYSSNANSVSNFDPMKPEMDYHNISTNISGTNCRLDNNGSGSAYSRMESQSQGPMYANMENRISSAPGSLYPGLDSQSSAPVYPGYENPPFAETFSSYDPTPKLEQEIKQESDQGIEINIKKEPEEAIKKEEGSNIITPKEETVEEKKGIEKVKTPFNVDTPIGMEIRPRHFRLHILNDSHKTMTARARVIHDWQKGGGVLLIGYELYRQLSLKKPNKAKRKRGQPFKDMVDVEEEDKNKGLLEEMHGALVNPGPDLVICDEGHRIKNSHASISLALKQMRTKRRIVLTGYPLQNNLLEYWCMVDFVRPNYLGTKSEFCNMFERPIQNGQCIDSTPQDIRLMRYRAHVLHALLEGFVQRRSHSVLQVSLPRKEEYILLVRMTAHQRKLYDTFMNQVVKTRAVPNPLKAFAVCCKIWNHPDILYHFLRKRQANEEDDLDLEETMGDKPTPGTKRSKARQPKGEPKKGKKTNNNTTIKNKPAASVQPNSSSSSSNDNVESDNSKAGNYPNYTLPVTNSGYSTSVAQGSYPQGYHQTYRSGDQNNFYRNEGTAGEYNEFYNSQGQQRYGNQSFQPYSQAPGYNSAQSYPSQPHSYLPSNNDQSGGHAQRYPPGPSSNDFRPDQTQGNNYDPTGIYPRQPYSYQDQGRSYTSSINQGTNYSQVTNQSQTYQNQLPNQASNLPISDYPSYTSATQSQNYTPSGGQGNQIYPRSENQSGQNMPPAQNSTLAYPSNQQSQTPTPQTQPVGYLATQQSQNPSSQNQSRGFSPNQQSQQSQSLQNPTHAYSSAQQGQTVTLQQQNQPHGYPSNQVGQNPTSQTSALGYAPSQQTSNSVTQNPNHGYAPNQSGQTSVVAHNQIRGYPSTPQGQNIPPQSQTTNIYPSHQQTSSSTSQSQTSRGYPVDQQGSISSSQNPIHGYPASHLVQTPTPQNQAPAFSPNPQSQAPAPLSQAHGYLTNQQGQTTVSQSTSHRYPANQQGQSSMSQSQAHGYSAIQQSQNSSLSQNSQIYSRSDNQTTQNYSATSNAPRDYPVDRQGGNSVATTATNYTQSQDQAQNSGLPTYSTETNHSSQVGQFKGPEDPYWQRNYSQSFRQDQCNDPYYRDSSVNRYQNNYFPSQNYSNRSYEYSTNHGSEMNSRSDESKVQSGTTSTHLSSQGTSDKSSKDITAGIGAQSQTISQDGLSTSTGYNNGTELNRQGSAIPLSKPSQNTGTCHGNNPKLSQSDLTKEEDREKEDELDKDKDKEDKSDDEILNKDEEKDSKYSPGVKEEPGIPYDWATELMKSYVPGLIDASAKMTLFFCILEEAVRIGDRVLAFSQSLFTLNLIEDFLARNSLKFPDGQTDAWVKNVNYYRLDGSTSALEREKLINEFNANPKIHLFLVSTRAGSLGINLVGANRAIVFDASWNPCHDTQAVCRVYRYGQQKPCFVYRLVTDNCLERKIYDRQISKQGMADRVVDQCNPDAHLSLKEATTLSWDWEEDGQVQDFSQSKDSYTDEVMHCVLDRHSSLLTKQPFHHESLLVDRKDKKLSQAEKRLARRGYELEKMAANCSRPSYSYVPGNTATRAGGLQIRAIRGGDTGATSKPVASVRPMQQRGVEGLGNARGVGGSRWIPAEVWQRQGMSAQEMTLPLDVVIPTNSPDKGSIVLKAGQRVMVLKSPKGIYMQLESGKIIAIRTALKLNQQKREEEPKKGLSLMTQRNAKPEVSFPLRNNSAISIIPKSSSSTQGSGRPLSRPSGGGGGGGGIGGGLGYRPFADKETAKRPKPVATAAAKPYLSHQVNLTNQVSLSRLPRVKQEPVDHSSIGENSNSSDSQVRTEQRVEEVRLEDVVAEVSSNTDYGSSNLNRSSNADSDSTLQKPSEDGTSPRVFSSDGMIIGAQSVQTRHEQADSSEITPIAEKERSPSENNESTKTDSLLDYDHSFESQKEKADASSDDIIIEEPLPPPIQQSQDVTKNLRDSSNSSAVSVSAGTNTATSPKGTESSQSVRDGPQGDPHSVPQGYPYAQYPRYYDYVDPRSRSLSNPYGTYFPSIPIHSASAALPVEPAKPQSDVGKSTDRGTTTSTSVIYPNQTSGSIRGSVKTPENKTEPKSIEATAKTTTTMTARDDTHVPTAFSHPTNTRYPGPYPAGPYDPYSQHYPPAPGSSAAYPPGGAPGYPAYGGPTYNSDYARMYSAFHGPPPAADPYMHRAYAPPTSHPPNYYPPFPHPPPPYPNYSFLPPYPNPNMPSEPQPPAQ